MWKSSQKNRFCLFSILIFLTSNVLISQNSIFTDSVTQNNDFSLSNKDNDKRIIENEAQKKEISMSTAVLLGSTWITYSEFVAKTNSKNFHAKNIEIIKDLSVIRSMNKSANIKQVIKVITK